MMKVKGYSEKECEMKAYFFLRELSTVEFFWKLQFFQGGEM